MTYPRYYREMNSKKWGGRGGVMLWPINGRIFFYFPADKGRVIKELVVCCVIIIMLMDKITIFQLFIMLLRLTN